MYQKMSERSFVAHAPLEQKFKTQRVESQLLFKDSNQSWINLSNVML